MKLSKFEVGACLHAILVADRVQTRSYRFAHRVSCALSSDLSSSPNSR